HARANRSGTGAAAARVGPRREAGGAHARPAHGDPQPDARLLGRAARDAQDEQEQGPQGRVTPRAARAVSAASVYGARARTSSAGSGRDLSRGRSTHTSTCHPAAESFGPSSCTTSKLSVSDLVPSRAT